MTLLIVNKMLYTHSIDDLAQNCSDSSTSTVKLLQSGTKPSICAIW